MGEQTSIEWTDHTFNPWWGCTHVSPACDHCYAETFAHRLGMNLWDRDGERRFFGRKHWDEPLAWARKAAADGVRRRVFCASMADVFEAHDELHHERTRLWELISRTPELDWLLLTKRPQNVLRMVPANWTTGAWPANAWIGTTVENQRYADLRIPKLLEIPAPVRFLSCEPLLGPIDLGVGDPHAGHDSDDVNGYPHPRICLTCSDPDGENDVVYFRRGPDSNPGVDWVIAGGESGPGARPMSPSWARQLRDDCVTAGVPYLFKQWGEWLPYEPDPQPPFWAGQDGDLVDGHHLPADLNEHKPTRGWWAPPDDDDAIYRRVGKKSAGRELDGRTWDQFPAPKEAPHAL